MGIEKQPELYKGVTKSKSQTELKFVGEKMWQTTQMSVELCWERRKRRLEMMFSS